MRRSNCCRLGFIMGGGGDKEGKQGQSTPPLPHLDEDILSNHSLVLNPRPAADCTGQGQEGREGSEAKAC
jgi:hypothetical protein